MPPRRNYALLLAYDGRPYLGFQPQASLPTVGGVLASALHRIGIGASPFGASRTDARVQALGQAISFQTRSDVDCAAMQRLLNDTLPSTLRVRALTPAEPSFHAHWSATGKTYRYRLSASVLAGSKDETKWPRLPGGCDTEAGHIQDSVDPHRLRIALEILSAQPDLSAFSASRARDGSKARQITAPRLLEADERRGILTEIRGTGFGRYQVRSLMAAALAFGTGLTDEQSLLAMVRGEKPHPFRAPAEGLCLVRVHYAADAAAPEDTPAALTDTLRAIPFLENYLTEEECRTGRLSE